MEDIGSILRQKKNSNGTDGIEITAALLNGVKNQTELFEYKEFNINLQQKFSEFRQNEIDGVKSYNEQFDMISDKYSGNEQAITESEEYKKLVTNIRNNTVSRRWQVEKLLLENSDIMNNNNVLGYEEYIDSGDNLKFVPWTENDYKEILNGSRPIAEDGLTVEGSHGKAVSAFLFDDINGMGDSENIKFQSKTYHFEVQHQGNYHLSGDEFKDINQKKNLVEHEQREIIDDYENADVVLGLVVGVTTGSISALIELRRMSKDSTPWNKKKTGKLALEFTRGAVIGVTPVIVMNTIDSPIRNFVDSSISDVFGIELWETTDSILDNIADSFGDFLVISTTIAAGKLVRNTIKGNYTSLVQGSLDFVGEMRRPIVEQAGFFVLDLFLDSVTPIPEPTLNVVLTGARVLYSSSKIMMNIKHRKELGKIKLEQLYDLGVAWGSGTL